MSTLSQSLAAAADKADAEAQDAIMNGDPEHAEAALRRAAQFRRLATNHRARAILTGDPGDDPEQITEPEPGITGTEIQARRTALEMTQVELGAALDVDPITLSRWERGQTQPAHPGMLRWALHGLMVDRVN